LGHSATVLITGLIAGELGGKSFSRTLASLCVLIAPAFLRIGSVFVIPSLEPAIWTLAAYLVLLIIKYDRPKLWILVGLVSGLGVMTKPTMLLFGCGLTLALAITPLRVQFLNRWIWLGGLTTMGVLLPNLIWQIKHDWITIEFIQSVKSSSWVNSINLSDFLFGQVFYLHPICAFIWMSGIYYFFFRHEAKTYRIFGWIYIIVLVLLISQGSKLYYLLPIYPLLFAAGSVNFEKWVALTRYRRLPACVLTIFAGAGIVMAPGGLPILSIKQFDQFAKIMTLGLIDAEKAPELFAMYRDMSGQAREVFLQDVARVYGSPDFSVVLFRPNFMLGSEGYLMKVHKNQWLSNPLSPRDIPWGTTNQGTPHGV
jgi:4-amino-4-deoxy-L-arabinose transferase-like glycosyltransferase